MVCILCCLIFPCTATLKQSVFILLSFILLNFPNLRASFDIMNISSERWMEHIWHETRNRMFPRRFKTNYGIKGDHRTNVILIYYFKDQLSQNVQIKEILGERNLSVSFLMNLEKKKRNRRMHLFSTHGHLEFFYPHIPPLLRWKSLRHIKQGAL